MAKMRAAVCPEPGRITMDEVERPEPGPGEVLVKVCATGLCGSDLDGYHGKHPMIGYPAIMGHECSGTVAAAGPGVSGYAEGDPVVVEPFFVCGVCPACLKGHYNLCVDLLIIGHQIPGSLAEYVKAQARFLHRKPAGVPFDEAAIAEPLSGSLHAVKRAGVSIGDFVVVIGCGTIGSLALQHVRNAGAEALVAEVKSPRADLAKRLGATHTLLRSAADGPGSLRARVLELTGGVGADVVIEAVGKPETLAETIGLARRGGTIMLIGWSGNPTDAMDMTSVTLNELAVLGTLGFCWDHKTALRLLETGKADIASLITHRLSLDETEKGLQMMASGDDQVGKIIVWSSPA